MNLKNICIYGFIIGKIGDQVDSLPKGVNLDLSRNLKYGTFSLGSKQLEQNW